MFARTLQSRLRRRGVVLVLILGMLGLLALVGVTFATFSGQAQIGSRNFAQSFNLPDANQVTDFGLEQLINDTNNPNSALRGHSLTRDMYGNDSAFAVRDPVTGNIVRFEANGFLDSLPAPCGASLFFLNSRSNPNPGPLFGFPQLLTNVPVGSFYPSLAGVDFTRWYVRIAPFITYNANNVPIYHNAQTFEVLQDDATGNDAFSAGTETCTQQGANMHLLTIAPLDNTTFVYNNFTGNNSILSLPLDRDANNNPIPIVLDGRYRRAFNGPGMTKWAQYANFRTNGAVVPPFLPLAAGSLPPIGDPNQQGMDEDYDGCDLENWFLAIQSADGQVVVPSFHRPGILTQADWQTTWNANDTAAAQLVELQTMSKFLRPRAIDHNKNFAAFPDLVPDINGSPFPASANFNPNFGKITFDVDNDGDGITDSVWLDLGYPIQRDASGKMFKPLFAFMVLGLNGRMPLNTAGNIQGLDISGFPTWDHTSHLGTSVNEINPKFALQNFTGIGYSQFDNPVAGPPQTPVDVTQLRNLLTGTRPQVNPNIDPALPPNNGSNTDANFVLVNGNPYYLPNGLFDPGDPGFATGTPPMRSTPPVAGRWGEVEGVPILLNQPWPVFNNPVRAGRSAALYSQYQVDATDDDFDTLDFFPPFNPNPPIPPLITFPEQADHYDLNGQMDLPSERIRRFVKPIDPIGTGRVMHHNSIPGDPPGQFPDYGRGTDPFGRASYFRYFRPPGFPMVLQTNGEIVFTPPGGTDYVNSATNFQGNNPYNGYDSERSPAGSGQPLNPTAQPLTTTANASSFMAAAPFTATDTAQALPTFLADINSTGSAMAANGYPFGSLNRDEADEMVLYFPTQNDTPFGFSDLEWLYRKHDTDGATLTSRLSSLAPISFLNPADGVMRRRLFSIDTWDMNGFVWSHDNPGGTVFPNNSQFAAFNGVIARPDLVLNPWLGNASIENYAMPAVLANQNLLPYYTTTPTPSLAHRDRKINLNFPLPPSNDPLEPVRQKWIRETYQFLKGILPPLSTDTPQELASLSQFVVNIIDFRDTDGTMTQFTNPDVLQVPATTTTPSTLVPVIPPPGQTTPPTARALVQFGMEYNPIAFNEAMAMSWRGRGQAAGGGTNDEIRAMFVEVVNTLTDGTNPTISDLNLRGWDMVLMPDDPTGRPDPITGDIPKQQDGFTMVAGAAYVPQMISGQPRASDTGMTVPVPALQQNGPGNPNTYYYVLANYGTGTPLSQGALNNWAGIINFIPATTLQPANQILPFPILQELPTFGAGSAAGSYFWLYLRRPANPFKPGQENPTLPDYNPMVVVDSVRFPFIEAGFQTIVGPTGKVIPNPTGAAFRSLYSAERLQPYRGGHSVPMAPGTTSIVPPTAYGFTEQTAAPANASLWQILTDSLTPATQVSLFQTIDLPNDPRDTDWDFMPFHDRDFQSVAELLLVPGCPVGLFTKQFVEFAPDPSIGLATPNATPPTTPPSAANFPSAGKPFLSSTIQANDVNGNPIAYTFEDPTSFPYLPDALYYTAMDPANLPTPPTPLNTPIIGGATGAGWYRMFEFFEVPSSAFGAIGPAVQGQNFDWFRQDLKPGLLNLNLIIDQEVFLGLIDDPRINTNLAAATSQLPRIVTQIDANGYPVRSQDAQGNLIMPGSYWMDQNNIQANGNPAGRPVWYDMGSNTLVAVAGMTAGFSDFLKLRHGASGFLFAFQAGPTGSGSAFGNPPPVAGPTTPAASERPFHSLSYPDIDYTLMRPATLPPSPLTTYSMSPNTPPSYIGDPGVKNPNLDAPTTTPPIPPIPPRRLFQLPDLIGSIMTPANPSTNSPPVLYMPTPPPAFTPSNASEVGEAYVNGTISHPDLANPIADLVSNTTLVSSGGQPFPPFLGGNPDAGRRADRRQTPYYRTEWLQKMMNLTTVRTHQFAVWVTVGFFEVTVQGNPQLGIADTLGQEMGLAGGRNVRFRSFFVLDRTRSIGFDLPWPGVSSNDFHNCVLYRRRIE